MNSNNTNSLYELIKQKSQQKGRPLKIISDWDECLQPVNPKIWWLVANEKGWHEKENLPFDNEWFRYFWENSRKEYTERGGESIETAFAFNEHLKDKSRQERRKLVEEPFTRLLKNPNYYDETPFLSIAEELLKCLKEDLISKLVIVTASNGKRKNNKFSNSFGRFSNTELVVQNQGRFKRGEYRWQWIKKANPDFDMFIDDDYFIMEDTIKNFSADKVFVMPDYKCNDRLQVSNVKVKQEISDIKDSDFAIAALELRSKQLFNSRERERERESKIILNDWGWDSDFVVRDFSLLFSEQEKEED